MNCCDGSVTIIDYGLRYGGGIGLFITMFLTGIVGSFTHCIGMCGPIAIGQMSMRLMNIPADQMNEKNKILCAASIPYYFGKSISYGILALGWFLIYEAAYYSKSLKIIGSILMLIAALFFIKSAIAIKFPEVNRGKINKLFNLLILRWTKITQSFHHKPFGFSGWILGMMLGLIPCGLVYASIATAVAYSNNAIISVFSMFIFGLGTMPGLFLVAYLGQNVLIRWRMLFDVLYFFSMLFNAYLLASASFKYLDF